MKYEICPVHRLDAGDSRHGVCFFLFPDLFFFAPLGFSVHRKFFLSPYCFF